jgi:bacillithiol biosynthesis cysteine-adding enzyme BshC
VSSPAAPNASTTPVRDAIDPQRFPWIRPLVTAYAREFDRLGSFFAGNPADPSAWRQAIARVQGAPRDRSIVYAGVAAQLIRRSAPPESRAALATLARPTAVAIVTGQQAGLFGGPLYALLKAVTAIRLARHVSTTYQVEAVPVFWVEGDDHDWAEVKSARVLDKDASVVNVTLGDLPGAGRQSVARLILDDSVGKTIARLAAVLPPTEFTPEVIAALTRSYAPGAGMAAAFAGWMDELLGREGLVVVEADDPALKPPARAILAREMATPRTAALARQAGEALAALGHPPQVQVADDAVAVFYSDADGRRAVRQHEDGLRIGESVRTKADVAAEIDAHPERFSPNVLLRPVVQDALFPTVCYVAGPAELAYQAQIGAVYQEHGVPAPLLYPRASVTLLDGAAARFFDRSGLPLEALQPQDDGALNRLLERELPADFDAAMTSAEQAVTERVEALKAIVAPIDPTLGGAVDTTIDRMRDTLKALQSKTVQAAKRKDETLRRQFAKTRTLTFPEGVPQERALNVAFFVNRYGLAVGARLLEALPIETDRHYLLVL